MKLRTQAPRAHVYSRIARCLTALLLITSACAASAKSASRITVLFPASGEYTYWVQNREGDADAQQKTRGGTRISVASTPGSTLYVMDTRTSHIVAYKLPERSSAIVVSGADFMPVKTSTAPPAPPVTSRTPAGATAEDTSSISTSPGEHKGGFSYLYSLGIAGVVLLIVIYLIASRGKPFAAAARGAGVNVPDPTAWDVREEDYIKAATQAVERVPDEAGASPGTQLQTAPPPPRKPIKGQPYLVGISGLSANTSYAISGRVMTIGRGQENGIVLKDNTISRCHARLERGRDGKITLTDEDSSNGIYVNGMRVEQAVLKMGDEVKIGASYFRFET
jgi:hypothetical protein